jgi:hypothetical protein
MTNRRECLLPSAPDRDARRAVIERMWNEGRSYRSDA